VSSGRDGWIRAWSAGPVTSFPTGGSILNGVAVGRRSGRVATVSRRRGIELWSGGGQRLAAFSDHACSAKSVHFAPDEKRVAAAYYDGHVALWEPETSRAELIRLGEAPLSQVAFAGRTLIASAWDRRGSLHVLDAQPLRALASLSVAA
jgi:WD40 repeat protein